MAELVNLDALIPREDFLASSTGLGADGGGPGKQQVTPTDLTRGESFHLTLRKPDFQRETAAWTPEAVRDFVKAFIEGDLIPSIICWQSPSRLTFVIDGAHRLSAIIAWILDDYGDGDESVKFYDNKILDKQRAIAKKTRNMIRDTVGTWKEIKAETANPGSHPRMQEKARLLAYSFMPLLWIKGTEASKAEKAFITINRSAVQIDATELRILNSRTKPNAIAARAIVRNATGYKYWETFSDTGKAELEETAKKINHALYSPPLVEPIRNSDLPIAGHGYGSQTLPLIFDFVNIANELPVIDATKRLEPKPVIHAPLNEKETLLVLANSRKAAQRLTGMHASSLGLHPAVYFYAANGKHQPTAVLAVAALIKDMEKRNGFNQFCHVRKPYEQFLLDNKQFINQLTGKYGSMAKGYRQVKEYLDFVFGCFLANKTAEDTLEALRQHDKYQSLVKERTIPSARNRDFSQDLKQWKFLTDTMKHSFECFICGARIDAKAMTMDHVKDQQHGGLATGENAEWTHPYCNSTFKHFLQSSNLPIALLDRG